MRLKGKVAIVTGAGRGIGRAIASALAYEGASLVADYNESKAQAEQLANDIKSKGGKVITVKADVTKSEEVKALVELTLDEFGTIDILVNNAGVVTQNRLFQITEDDWDYILDVNLKGPFLCSQAVAKTMLEKKSGKIINISSVAGTLFEPSYYTHYATSKSGVIGLTKSLALLLAPHIQVNAIAPGTIYPTGMTRMLTQERISEIIDRTLLKRVGTPEDIAKVVTFLASSDSDFITGEVIFVTGART